MCVQNNGSAGRLLDDGFDVSLAKDAVNCVKKEVNFRVKS